MAMLVENVLKLVEAGFTAEAITAMLEPQTASEQPPQSPQPPQPPQPPQTDGDMTVAEYLKTVNESISQLSQQLQANSRLMLGGQIPEPKTTLDVLQARLDELNGKPNK